jgi:hypothetical protein
MPNDTHHLKTVLKTDCIIRIFIIFKPQKPIKLISMEIKPTRPDSYLALAIISTILCCLPTGIVSIIYATKVNSAYEDGNYDEAIKASKNAKTWGLISIGAAFLGLIIYVLFFGLAIFGAILSGH